MLRILLIAVFSLVTTMSFASEEVKYSEKEYIDRPLMERYILDELKQLRMEQQDLERRLTI
ncbi:hypothetical protein L4D02_25335, partial [Vibrio splendidus]